MTLDVVGRVVGDWYEDQFKGDRKCVDCGHELAIKGGMKLNFLEGSMADIMWDTIDNTTYMPDVCSVAFARK